MLPIAEPNQEEEEASFIQPSINKRLQNKNYS